MNLILLKKSQFWTKPFLCFALSLKGIFLQLVGVIAIKLTSWRDLRLHVSKEKPKVVTSIDCVCNPLQNVAPDAERRHETKQKTDLEKSVARVSADTLITRIWATCDVKN